MNNPPQETSKLKACSCKSEWYGNKCYVTICGAHTQELSEYNLKPGTVFRSPPTASADIENLRRYLCAQKISHGERPEDIFDRIMQRMK